MRQATAMSMIFPTMRTPVVGILLLMFLINKTIGGPHVIVQNRVCTNPFRGGIPVL